MTSWPSKSTLQRLLDLAGLHYTTWERSGPFWQSMLHNFLSRPLSFLGWTTAMLFWLDFHQTQPNLYKWYRMQQHDWSSTSPKEPMLHLSLFPCTGYQLQRASSSTHWCLHITTTGSAPAYFHSLLRIYIPSRSLRSASERRHRGTITERLKITLQNILVHHSWLVEWSSHPYPECWIPVNLQAKTENSSLSTLLDFILNLKKQKTLSFSLFIPSLASLYLLNNDWDLVLRALPLSVCLFKMNRFMYSPIVSRFG